MSDFGGLLAEPGASQGSSSRESLSSAASTTKRQKLRHYDLLPCQLLNPMGISGIESADLGKLWKFMGNGNKGAMYFSELCDADEGRHRVAISRLAEVLGAIIERINEPMFKAIVKEDVYDTVKKEGEALAPHLSVLNRKGESRSDSSLKYAAVGKPIDADPVAQDAAAKKLYEFLVAPQSALRAFIAIVSAGGLTFAAQCHEKGARAYVKSGVDEATFKRRVTMGGDVAGGAGTDDFGAFTGS